MIFGVPNLGTSTGKVETAKLGVRLEGLCSKTVDHKYFLVPNTNMSLGLASYK